MAIFDTSGVRPVKAHTDTSIVKEANQFAGTDDLLKEGAKLATGYAKGKAFADLTGQESNAAEVVSSDEYGTFNYEEGEPVSLSIDTDLTRISNARKQRRISAERARALVNIRTRQAINDNPTFAAEIQDRAERFFSTVGGGSSVGSGNILEPTAEEELEREIEEQNVMDLREEQMTAQQLGMSVPEYRRRQREKADRERAKERMTLRAKQAEVAEAETEEESEANTREFNRDMGLMLVDAQMQVGQHVNTLVEEGGGITAENRADIRVQIQNQSNEFLALLQANRASLGTEEVKRQRQEIEAWRDNLIGVVEEADLESLYETVRDRNNTVMDLTIQKEMPLVYGLGRIDSELPRLGIELLSDRNRLEQLAQINPMARFVLDNENIFDRAGLTTMVANSLTAAATGDEEARAKIPGSEADKDNVIDMEWLLNISGEAPGGEQMHDRAWDNYREVVNRQGAVALNAATTPKTQREVRSDKEKQEQLANAYDFALRGLSLAIERGDVDLSQYNIRIEDRGEHDPRKPGDHPQKNQSWLSPSFWNERRFGHTGGPPVSVDMRELESQIQQDSYGRIPDYERQELRRETARQIQALARIASTYPELKLGDQTLMDAFVNRLGIGQEMRNTYGMSEEQAGDIEEEQSVNNIDTSVKDVEFDPGVQVGGEASPTELEFEEVQGRETRDARPIPGPFERDIQTGRIEPTPFEVEGGEEEDPAADALEDPVADVFSHLARREGEGDDLTDVATGKLGVTQEARDAVGANKNTPDRVVARRYLDHLDTVFENGLEGYTQSPPNVKQMVLDASYNMGEKIKNFTNFSRAIKDGDYDKAAINLLDTANVKHKGQMKSVKGLAKRRAESYNLYADEPVTVVEQLEDGTIKYLGEGGQVIFEYRPDGGRREADANSEGSAPGKIRVPGT